MVVLTKNELKKICNEPGILKTVSYKNGMSVNTIYIVGYIINDVLVSDGQFTIVNVGTN